MSCDEGCCKVDVCLNIVDVCITDDAKLKFQLILSGMCNESGSYIICHVTPSGEKQTLKLPLPAAMAHLKNHPLDTIGPCPVEEVIEEVVVDDEVDD